MNVRAVASAAALALLGIGCAHAPPAGGPPKITVAEAAAFDEIAKLEDARDPGAAHLLPRLDAGDAAVRRRAVRAIGRLQEPASVPALARALADADEGVRSEAAFAFELLGLSWEPLDEPVRAAAAEAVRDALARARGPARAPLLFALGALTDAAGTAPLVALLADPDPVVAGAAARALGGWLHRTKTKWDGLLPTSLGEPLVVKRARAYLFFRAAAPVTAGLSAAALADADAEVRALGARGLGAMKDAAHLRALGRAATSDPDWRVRVEAVRALAAVAAEDTGRWSAAHLYKLAVFTAALWLDQAFYEVPELAAPVVELAADHGFAGTVPGDHPEAAQVLLAAFAAKVPPALAGDAATALLPGLAHAREVASGPHLRTVAQMECLAAAAADRAAGALDELLHCGGAAVTDAERDRAIARALGEGEWKDRERELLARLKRPDPATRALAIESLGHIGKAALSDDARAALRAALADPDGPIVAGAADALAALADEAAAPPLLDALARFPRPEDAEIAQSIVAALGALKAPAAEAPLRRLLASPSPPVRAAARRALADLGAKDLAPVTPAAPAPRELRAPAESTLRLDTDRGTIRIALARDEAPATARAISDLARKGFYDGLTFHRIVPDFVTQGGDPRGDGWGGPGHTLRCELSPLRYERGAVGMALSGKDTGGSQFFIAHAAQPHLDGRYTIFGLVVEGMDVVDRLIPGDHIIKAILER